MLEIFKFQSEFLKCFQRLQIYKSREKQRITKKNGELRRKMENFVGKWKIIAKLKQKKIEDRRQKKRETEQKGKKRKEGGRGEKKGERKGEREKRLERNVSDRKYDKGQIK